MRAATVLAVSFFLSATLIATAPGSTGEEPVSVVSIGIQDQMRTRNLLRGSVSDPWALPILAPVYAHPILTSEPIGVLLPHVLKGTDHDGDGSFEADEYAAFQKASGTNGSDVTAYFDFNGLRWHDGTQMTATDVLFSLQLASMSPVWNVHVRPLWDDPSAASFPSDRHVNIDLSWCNPTDVQWSSASGLAGMNTLRCALRFRLHVPYAPFFERTLGHLWLLPRHVWEDTGNGRHVDFGLAVYPPGHPRAGQGIPTYETAYMPFNYAAAEAWEPSDFDVIGSGPFRFTTLISGALARIDRNDAYYWGRDPSNPAFVYDPRMNTSVHPPHVGGIEFRIHRTTQLGVLALQAGEIDYYLWNIPPEFVPDLLNTPEVTVWAGAELGYPYIGFNLRRQPFGYSTFPPVDSEIDDVGRPFRTAFARLADKQTMVRTHLGNYGIVTDSPVSPVNRFWYNASLPLVSYDPSQASLILDNAGWMDADGDGWREFPSIGDRQISILTPQSDYPIFPEQPTPAGLIATAARSIRVNVVAEPIAFSALSGRIERRDFDMFAAQRWSIGPDPDYLFDLFHCGQAAGANDAGYCDATFDYVVEQSRSEMNRTERQRLIRWAQAIFMEDHPVEPLFSRTVVQATRSDQFVNWTSEFGSLWNYWSWIGVRPVTSLRTLNLAVEFGSAMPSQGRQRIDVTVRDDRRTALQGAEVTLTILPQDGGRFVETSAANVIGRTGATGSFSATYEAPAVSSLRDIVIDVAADHPDARQPIQRGILITVFPDGVPFLSLHISVPAGDLTEPGGVLPIRLQVRDETGTTVGDAMVTAGVTPDNATVQPPSGTATTMAQILFSPPTDLRASQSYRVSFLAAKSPYHPANTTVSLLVVYREEVRPPDQGLFPAEGDMLLLVGGLAAAGLGSIAVAWLVIRRRRRLRPGS